MRKLKLSVLFVSGVLSYSAAQACLPPPPSYTDLSEIKHVLDSEELTKSLGSIDVFSGVASVSPDRSGNSSVSVKFNNGCEAKFKITYKNFNPDAPCGYGYRPDKVERTALVCPQ